MSTYRRMTAGYALRLTREADRRLEPGRLHDAPVEVARITPEMTRRTRYLGHMCRRRGFSYVFARFVDEKTGEHYLQPVE